MTHPTPAKHKPITRGELNALRHAVELEQAAFRREVEKEWTRPGVDPAWMERADAKYRKRRARYIAREKAK
jgi:hypothetical protein